MKDLTSSVYSFEDLIKGKYLYVDKTEYIWNLIRPYKGIYFMSRLRRFGKSLTVSTLEAIFPAKKSSSKDWRSTINHMIGNLIRFETNRTCRQFIHE